MRRQALVPLTHLSIQQPCILFAKDYPPPIKVCLSFCPEYEDQSVEDRLLYILIRVMSDQDLVQVFVTSINTTIGCMRWYFTILYTYIIPTLEDVHALRPPKYEALEEVAAEEQGDHQQLDISAQLRRIEDDVWGIMGDGQMEREVRYGYVWRIFWMRFKEGWFIIGVDR